MRDHARIGREGRQAGPAGVVDLGGVVRVDADRGVEPREAVDERERALARGDVPAGDEDPLDAGQPGAADDQVGVTLEAVGVEVAVAVDEAHPASVQARGFRVEPREERLRRRHAARLPRVARPRPAPRGSAGRRCRRAPYGYSYPSWAEHARRRSRA